VPPDAPATPAFTTALEVRLTSEAGLRKRVRRPFSIHALGRLRRLSSLAGHVGAAVALSATLLLLSPATLQREVALPPVAEPPPLGYLAQYGAPGGPEATITMAREAGFEVEIVRTYVADRAADGAIVEMRHLSQRVHGVPVNETARGLLLVVIGLTIGDAGTTAD
jgi:hypothetical protein